jgi:translation initiation factor 3 subunit G
LHWHCAAADRLGHFFLERRTNQEDEKFVDRFAKKKKKKTSKMHRASSSTRWGASSDDDMAGQESDEDQILEEAVDDDGIKTVVLLSRNDDGKKVKLMRKYRVENVTRQVNTRVEARKKWRKFGECYGKPAGMEPGISMYGDDVYLESAVQKRKEKKKVTNEGSLGVVCRHCGAQGDHWTPKCPFKDKLGQTGDGAASSSSSADGKYRPPIPKPGSAESQQRLRDERDATTLRVTNLSDSAREEDLADLFRKFGRTSRIYLVKDRATGLSRGFAFVTYDRRDDAARALEALDGHGYDHLILHVEWSKPSRK